MPSTILGDLFGTFEQLGKLRPAETRMLEASLTLCAMSWTCSSTSAATTMMEVIADMLRGATTPKGWPRVTWKLWTTGCRLSLQLVEVPLGSTASEGALELPF